MRIAIISDIHEDFESLEKAFERMRRVGYDLLVCLGDITGFASEFYSHTSNANACIDLLKEFAQISLAGNHDLFTSRRLPSYYAEKAIPENWFELSISKQQQLLGNKIWLYEDEVHPVLSSDNHQYLQSLHEWEVLDTGSKKILFSHFVKPDLAGVGRWFPIQTGQLRQHFRFMEEMGCCVAFTGHCHTEGLSLVSRYLWSKPSFEKTTINNSPKIALCPALVNNCKCLPGFIIFDAVTGHIFPQILT